jgi:hypothetical protein
MAITVFSPSTAWATIATAVNAMSPGDIGVFVPGAYTASSSLFPANNTFLVGTPGTNITLVSGVDVFRIDNNTSGVLSTGLANTTNIYISGFTISAPNAVFTGTIAGTALTSANVGTTPIAINMEIWGPGITDNTKITAGSGTSWTITPSQTVTPSVTIQGAPIPQHGVFYTNGCIGCSFVGNTLTNINGASPANCFSMFRPRMLRIDNNIFNACAEGISCTNTDATPTYFGISISENTFNGMLRNAIEIHSGPGTGGFDGVHILNNTIYNSLDTITGGGIPIGIVNDYTPPILAAPTTDLQIIGNDIWFPNGIGIEAVAQGIVCAYNRITGSFTQSGVAIGHCGSGSYFYGNIFRSFNDSTKAFTKDGGWNDSQWIGPNMINGVLTNGWQFGNTAGLAPPNFDATNMTALMNSLHDQTTPGPSYILPRTIRSIVGSTPLGPLSSWNVYP